MGLLSTLAKGAGSLLGGDTIKDVKLLEHADD